MAGRFPLLTDACVNDHLVQALSALGGDVVRAIDLYPERTKDEVLFARAATEGRVLSPTIARRRRIGDFAQDFEALAKEDDPFAYPVRHLKVR